VTQDDTKQWNELAAGATSLADDKFMRVVELLEAVLAKPGVAAAFETLRPRLKRIRPARKLTAQRLMYLPAEDLLDNAESYRRRLFRISRGTLNACWKQISQRLGADKVAAIESRLDGASTVSRSLQRVGEQLWRDGAKALRAAIEEAASSTKTRIALFGRDDDVLRQVAILAEVAELGPAIEALKAELPDPPISELSEAHVDVLRKAIQEVSAEGTAHLTTFLLVVSSRMQRPGELLRILADTRLDEVRPDEKDDVAREVGVFTVENLLRRTAEITPDFLDAVTAREVAQLTERLVDGLESMNSTLAQPDQKKLAQRAEQARGVISNALFSHVLRPAEQELLRSSEELSLPTRQELSAAEEFARAYRRCQRIAPALGLRSEMQEKTAGICRQVEGITESLADFETAGDIDPESLKASDGQIIAMLRLIEIVAGPDEATRLLDKWESRTKPALTGA
jgi:hypothetical protein